MIYISGHVKRNPDNGTVAVRTGFPEDDYPDMAWLAATVNTGAKTLRTSDVEDWEDLFVATEEVTP